MTLEDVLEHFGTGYNLEKLHGISHTNIRVWRAKGYVPIESQLRLERLTEGALLADLSHCPRADLYVESE